MSKPRDGITTRQKLFVQEYIKTKGNGQEAAMRVYDAKNENVARNIASTNLTKPNIRQELEKALNTRGLRLDRVTNKLAAIIEETPDKGYSGADIMDAIKTTLKLHGVLVDRKQSTNLNLTADYNTLSEHELITLRKKKQQETDDILS